MTGHTRWEDIKHRRGWLPEPERPLLWVQVGSTVYGTAIEGTDDRDEVVVTMETPAQLLGASGHLKNASRRTAQGSTRSGPGDIDRQEYSLRSFAGLAAKGNPSILATFFCPNVDEPDSAAVWGPVIRRILPLCLSMRVVGQFQGYMKSQVQAVTKSASTPVGARRPELVEAHGYDTKAAMHAARLGLQGLELAYTNQIRIPIDEPDRGWLMAVRRGLISFAEWTEAMAGLEERVNRIWSNPPWPDEPDMQALDHYLVDVHREYWNW